MYGCKGISFSGFLVAKQNLDGETINTYIKRDLPFVFVNRIFADYDEFESINNKKVYFIIFTTGSNLERVRVGSGKSVLHS